MEYKLLQKIKEPADIKGLNKQELNLLCEEIRDCLIKTVSKNGGHLASNLGVVELTVAIHRVFNSPEDAILFDVGHQSYTHKLLTGRFKEFSTLRKENGLSGYMKPSESPHDPFITGHSSNSISAAYGIYKAKSLLKERGTAVAVIGDGALTGGMAYEALNNSGSGRSNFVVILNDNKMSISRNVGALARYLNVIRSSKRYYGFKRRVNNFISAIPLVGDKLYSKIYRSKLMLKNALYHSNFFESMGFNYYGPVDGHNIEKIEQLLNVAKSQNRPALIHVVTVKGKGYAFAETSPKTYHGVSSFDIEEGAKTGGEFYSSVAANTLIKLADRDEKICAVTAAMTEGTSLNGFASKYRTRFFDVGIAEEHALTFTAGLASAGMKPYFFVYSSFLQRAYDQIIHDAAIGNFPIRICIDRAGIVGEDGETHQGLFDVGFLSSVPGVNIYSPASYDELENTLISTADINEIIAIRYPRGKQPENGLFKFSGKEFDVFFKDKTKLLISYGRLSYNCYNAAQENNDTVFLKLNKIYPIADSVLEFVKKFDKVLMCEETEKNGSIGEHLCLKLCEDGYSGKFVLKAIDNEFVACAATEDAIKNNGLDTEAIVGYLRGI